MLTVRALARSGILVVRMLHGVCHRCTFDICLYAYLSCMPISPQNRTVSHMQTISSPVNALSYTTIPNTGQLFGAVLPLISANQIRPGCLIETAFHRLIAALVTTFSSSSILFQRELIRRAAGGRGPAIITIWNWVLHDPRAQSGLVGFILH